MEYIKFADDQYFYFHRGTKAIEQDSLFYPMHYHNLVEIYFITEGTCEYFIGSRSYRLEPGDLVLIPAGVMHNTAYKNTGHDRMLINCSRRFIPTRAIPKGHLYRNEKIVDQIRDIFLTIEREYTAPDRWSEDVISSSMKLLFILLARNPNTYTTSGQGNQLVARAVDYLQENFASDITLEELAKHFAVSPEHLCRLFKRETGVGFREYLNLLRLQRAEKLLRQQRDRSVAQIAAECGFGDSNYFSVKFKSMYGISPKQFQLQNTRK
ncbi:MAG: AraC family transcriptional regulator [Oscillospiraceae bacterium]|nr:AraC family transcriptional regulator [Oscillospiraceae bacterium]